MLFNKCPAGAGFEIFFKFKSFVFVGDSKIRIGGHRPLKPSRKGEARLRSFLQSKKELRRVKAGVPGLEPETKVLETFVMPISPHPRIVNI